MGILDELGIKYGTDKSSRGHGYLNVYEKYLSEFKDKPISFMEIGMLHGASVNVWQDYFTQAKLYGVDCRKNRLRQDGRVKSFWANQANREHLEKIVQETGLIDIIVDDGGHQMSQQQISLGFLFPYIKSNGLYIIEDLHTSWDVNKAFNVPYDPRTTLHALKKLRDEGKIDAAHITPTEAQYINDNTKSCIIEIGENGVHSEIAFIRKK